MGEEKDHSKIKLGIYRKQQINIQTCQRKRETKGIEIFTQRIKEFNNGQFNQQINLGNNV